ncbi:MAG: hypothetical protein QF619_13465 [Candidatus Binatia bacterium]|jgi:hypothetical protein|nr:hypothetical protein [Candidatus Binatia bacterium]
MTPRELKSRFDHVLRSAAETGRDGDRVLLSCCLPIELTKDPVLQEEGRLKGAPTQIFETLKGFPEIGVAHMALQFMVPRWPERQEQIERFAKEVIPSLRQLKLRGQ